MPFALVALLGVEFHALLPRSFAFGIWVPIVSLAAVLEELRRRLSAAGAVLGCALLALVLIPPTVEHVQEARERHVALDEVRARLRPGDRVSISPTWFAPVIEWEFAAKDGFRILGLDRDGRFVVADTSSEPSGRTHLLDHAQLVDPTELRLPRPGCGQRLDTYSWILRCQGATP